MKAHLLFKDQDFDLQRKLPVHASALVQDLELNTLFNAMASGDKFVFEVARAAVLSSVTDLETIRYRQHILTDCLKHPAIVREIYALAIAAIEGEKQHYLGLLSKYPDALLRRSVEVLQMFVGMLKKLRSIADEHADVFASEGFTRFFAMLKQELDDAYFASVQQHLRELQFKSGVLISAQLGQGNKGSHYVLRKPHEQNQSWTRRLFAEKAPAYTFHIADRDESGGRALSELLMFRLPQAKKAIPIAEDCRNE